MTEQATAQAEQNIDDQAEKKKKEAADLSAQEEAQRLKREKFLRDLAEIRDSIRDERQDRGAALLGSKFLESGQAQHFRQALPLIDPSSVDFLTGIEAIASIEGMKKNPGFFLIKTNEGLEFSHSVNQAGVHRFGLTDKQAKNIPLTPQLAAQWMDMAAATGSTSVAVHGTPDHKEVLWLEASKRGLAVTNFQPSPETLKAFEDYLAERANGMPVGVTVEPAADAAQNTAANQAKQPIVLTPISGSKIAGGAGAPAQESRHVAQIGHQEVKLLTDQSNRRALPPPTGPK